MDKNINSENISFNSYVNEINNNSQLFVDNDEQIFFDNGNIKVIEVEFSDTKIKNRNNLKNILIKILVNKKFLKIVLVLLFVFVSLNVCKVIYLRNVVDNYEEFFTVIESKSSDTTIIYNDSILNGGENDKDNAAMSEFYDCIKSPLEEIPDSINLIIKDINLYYNQSNNYFAFKYKDIYTGFSVSYNENQNIFTASTIKAPKDIYIYEMASLGKINLDDELTYTSNYYNTGSGTLKHNKFNTKYKVKTLLMYSTAYSDNAAHNMLMDKYGRENMLSFWKNKGTTAIFTQYNNWGVTNAHDAVIYMEELYNFYINDDKYGQELMNNFLSAKPKFLLGKNNYKVANKSGWSGSAIHDVAIVFANNPYIVVALSNLGDTDYYNSYFNKANDFAYRLHTEYWKYKMNMCNEINQY